MTIQEASERYSEAQWKAAHDDLQSQIVSITSELVAAKAQLGAAGARRDFLERERQKHAEERLRLTGRVLDLEKFVASLADQRDKVAVANAELALMHVGCAHPQLLDTVPRIEFEALKAENARLIGRNIALNSDLANRNAALANAEKLVASMHAAAMGRVCGPLIGVVEDVANNRECMLKALEDAQRLQVERDAARTERSGVEAKLAAETREAGRLRARVEAMKVDVSTLSTELERERVRLGGCLIAAEGGRDVLSIQPGDYAFSASLDAVRKLRAERDRLEAELNPGAQVVDCGTFDQAVIDRVPAVVRRTSRETRIDALEKRVALLEAWRP